MSDEEITGGSPERETAPTDIRSTINAAIEAQLSRAEAKEPARAEPAEPAGEPDDASDTEAAKTSEQRARDEKGRFAKAESEGEPAETAEETETEEAEAEAEPDPTQNLRPPPGWSPAAKVAFNKLKAGGELTLAERRAVIGDIGKREEEVNRGFAKLAEYKPIERYAEMAKASGTTLDKALESYIGMENLLRRDIFAGVEAVLHNVGVNPQQFITAYAARMGFGGEQVAGGPQQQPQFQQPAFDPNALRTQILDDLRQEQAIQAATSAIERARNDSAMPFFANVEDQVERLIKAGVVERSNDPFETLQRAYQTACRLDPQISELIKQQTETAGQAPTARKTAAVAQAKQAAKAVGGAPAPGTKPAAPPIPKNFSAAHAVEMQLARG
jgi:hypothetical protein